jgi:hypothetical protein
VNFNGECQCTKCRARRVVLSMCPYPECAAAGKCMEMGSYQVKGPPSDEVRFCRLRPPLTEIVGAP